MSAREIPRDVMEASWAALFNSNIVRTPMRKLLVISTAKAILAERERCRAETLEAAAKVAEDRAPATQDMISTFVSDACDDIAAAIRALGGEDG